MARSLYEAINGDRTVAEILLHVHGSEYLVTKFLYELLRNGFLEITGIREVPQALRPELPASETIPDHDRPSTTNRVPPVEGSSAVDPATVPADEPETAPAPAASPLKGDHVDHETFEFDPEGVDAPAAMPDPVAAPAAAAVSTGDAVVASADEPVDEFGVESIEDSSAYQFEKRLSRARALMASESYADALGVLDELYKKDPNNESLRRLTAEAEAAFIEKAYRHFVPPQKVPILLKDASSLESETLTPSEFFLLSRFDGTWDVRSIIQIAPLREVEALLALKNMRERGIIELREPKDAVVS